MANITRRDVIKAFGLLASGAVLVGVSGVLEPVLSLAVNGTVTRADHDPDVRSMSLEVDGTVAYCADSVMTMPTQGCAYDSQAVAIGILELDYVMYHGYDGVNVTSLYGLNARNSRTATQTAVWLAIGTQRQDLFHYNTSQEYHSNDDWAYQTSLIERDYPEAYAAGVRLYNEGIAYRNNGGGGPEEGCSVLWMPGPDAHGPGGWAGDRYQILLTKQLLGSIVVRKVVVGPSTSDTFPMHIVVRRSDDSVFLNESFSLAGGESRTFGTVPVGCSYEVSEIVPAGYSASWENATGTISESGSVVTATCTNRHLGYVTLNKRLSM